MNSEISCTSAAVENVDLATEMSNQHEGKPSISRPLLETMADLEVLVRKFRVEGQLSLSYELTARDPQLGLIHKDLGSVVLQVDPQDFFNDLLMSIDSLPSDDVARRVDKLQSRGAALARELLPPDLREKFWELRHDVRTVQIFSNEGWIPWEMLRIQGPTLEQDDFFLSEKFALTRWLYGHPAHLHLPLRNLAMVATRSDDLPAVAEELSLLTNLFPGAERVEPAYLELKARLAAGGFDVWHFMGHGVLCGDDPNRWSIPLIDDELNPESLDESTGGFAADRTPLFFLNVCYSGRGARSLTGMGGWARRLLELGAGAFVGPVWATQDDAAKELALVFYERLLSGFAIGEAMRQARLAVRDGFPGDPSWLAYTVFAHPAASFHPVPQESAQPSPRQQSTETYPHYSTNTAVGRARARNWSTGKIRWPSSLYFPGLVVLVLSLMLVLQTLNDKREDGLDLPSLESAPKPNSIEGGKQGSSVAFPPVEAPTDKGTKQTKLVQPPPPRKYAPAYMEMPKPGRVLVGVLNEESMDWDWKVSHAAAVAIQEKIDSSHPAIADSAFVDAARQLLSGKNASFSGEMTAYGVEYILLAIGKMERPSLLNKNAIALTLDIYLFDARSGRVIARDSSMQTGLEAAESEAIKMATERCLRETLIVLYERFNQ